jgi:hypothetical protein
MNVKAQALSTRLIIEADNVVATCEAVLASLEPLPWPEISEWSAPMRSEGGVPRTGSLRAALRSDPTVAASRSLSWKHGEDITFWLGHSDEGIELTMLNVDAEPEHCWRWLVATEELLGRFLEGGMRIRYGTVARQGVGVACLPRLPLVHKATYMVVADEPALAWAFERPDDAIRTGDWEARQIRGRRLLSRAMHAETNVEMLEAIQEGQWSMARLARPGLTEYLQRDPEPEEEPIFLSGERTVLAAGCLPDERTAVFSCALGPDQHVNGWEVFALLRILVEHRLHTGEEVQQVQVVFADRASAEREKRPLLDIGVHVLYYDGLGRMQPLDEPVPRGAR